MVTAKVLQGGNGVSMSIAIVRFLKAQEDFIYAQRYVSRGHYYIGQRVLEMGFSNAQQAIDLGLHHRPYGEWEL